MNPKPLAPVLLATLLLAGCGASTPGAGSSPAPTSAPPTTAGSTTSTPTAAPTQTAVAVQTIEVTVAGGEIVGGLSTVDVPMNTRFRLMVTSDAADEVHLHGYDLKAEVAAGGTVTIEGTATIPGVVVAELEGAALTIVRIATQ